MNRNMLARRWPMKLQWVAVVLGLLALVLLAAPAHMQPSFAAVKTRCGSAPTKP